jgi:hypothetical protein
LSSGQIIFEKQSPMFCVALQFDSLEVNKGIKQTQIIKIGRLLANKICQEDSTRGDYLSKRLKKRFQRYFSLSIFRQITKQNTLV